MRISDIGVIFKKKLCLPQKGQKKDSDNKENVTKSKNTKKEQLLIDLIAFCILVGLVVLIIDNFYVPENENQLAHKQNSLKPAAESISAAQPSNLTQYPNPFVDLQLMRSEAVTNARNDSSASNSNIEAANRTQQLPAIPSYNPSYNMMPPSREIPSPSIQNNAPKNQSVNAVQVQGILTNDDAGNNMAIMSDGSIVTAGESFNDNRIAYIGGDGITFDNGQTMHYEQ